ncbi:BTAD domain-containing putative transcriptional regulator [Streptomyces sp. UNOB3_S3]|uniref:BTAD domain-containing putative transcriptional regulator n=1 Tax=Streptomyces sp. UNOB3_S3 TaxID=2871682 RepID=UPI001E490B5A|nr:BTAD domain-containing putative transcriptional regulator [Streptomyces sp. UNOB3_S3]MCC3776525.1 AAA family ATPase [Streptomyces sp. UNOB3_S3]
MEFRLLGPLEVLADDVPVVLGGTKQRATLGSLLLQANRVVPTSELLSSLWDGDGAPATARKILQNAVWALRGLLAAGGTRGHTAELVTKAPGYMLKVDPGRVDLFVFRQRVADGRAALAAQAPEAAAVLLREALDLWRGPVLADLVETGVSWPELTAAEKARLDAMEEFFEAELTCGRHHAVLGRLEAMVEGQPHRERSSAQLMLALYRCGRQADALNLYDRVRAALGEGLGLEPGQGLRMLQRAILQHDPSLLTPGASGPAPRMQPVPPSASALPAPATPSAWPATVSGQTAGSVPGAVSGSVPGPASGSMPGLASGAVPGPASGPVPGLASGLPSGSVPGLASGPVPGSASGLASGATPGLMYGPVPGPASGSVSGPASSAVPGLPSGPVPGVASGVVPGAVPGLTSGPVPGAVPGLTSGLPSSPVPGLGSGPGAPVALPATAAAAGAPGAPVPSAPLAATGGAAGGPERMTVSALLLCARPVGWRTANPGAADSALEGLGSLIREEVERCGGTFVTNIGSVALALFGIHDPRGAAERAVRAALAVRVRCGADGGAAVTAAVTSGPALVRLPGGDGDGAPPTVVGTLLDEGRALLARVPDGRVWVCGTTRRDISAALDLRRAAGRPDAWEVLGVRGEPGALRAYARLAAVGDHDHELDLVAGLLEWSRLRGLSHLVTVLGEPGSGKTRFLADFERRALEATRAPVRIITAYPPDDDDPGPLALPALVLAECCDILPGDSIDTAHDKLTAALRRQTADAGERRRLYERLLPLLSPVGAALRRPEVGDVLDAWREFTVAAARVQPLVVAVDDMHLAGDELLRCVESLADTGADDAAALLVVVTARPGLLRRRPRWAGSMRRSVTITLTPPAGARPAPPVTGRGTACGGRIAV